MARAELHKRQLALSADMATNKECVISRSENDESTLRKLLEQALVSLLFIVIRQTGLILIKHSDNYLYPKLIKRQLNHASDPLMN